MRELVSLALVLLFLGCMTPGDNGADTTNQLILQTSTTQEIPHQDSLIKDYPIETQKRIERCIEKVQENSFLNMNCLWDLVVELEDPQLCYLTDLSPEIIYCEDWKFRLAEHLNKSLDIEYDAGDKIKDILAKSTPIECKEFENVFERDQCISDLAVSRKSKELCNKIAYPDYTKWCIESIGEETRTEQTIEECLERYEYGEMRESICTYEMGKAELNVSLCNKIDEKSYRYNCYFYIIDKKVDGEICSLIDDTDISTLCNAIYLYIINKKGDREICSLINDTDISTLCNAIYLNQIDLCKNIQEGFFINTCFSSLAVLNNDISMCELSKSQKEKDLCYKKVAINTNDNYLCEKIVSEDIRYSCKGVITGDISSCLKIKNSFTQQECLWEIALDRNNRKACDEMELHANKIYCYKELGQDFWDKSICTKIIDPNMQWRCYYNLAITSNDKKICDRVDFNDQKTECIKRVEEGINYCFDGRDYEKICQGIQTREKDESYCIDADKCLIEYAKMTYNPMICDKLKDQSFIQECRVYFCDTLSEDEDKMDCLIIAGSSLPSTYKKNICRYSFSFGEYDEDWCLKKFKLKS